MNCSAPWTREFIDSSLTKSFINNDLKKHRQNVLIEREKSLLPATMPFVVQEKTQRDISKKDREFKTKRAELMEQLRELDLERRLNIQQNPHYGQEHEERSVYIRKCIIENCRGFLSSHWKCELCSTVVCNKCYEPKVDDGHECNPDNVKTTEMLKEETKTCPQCATLIYKIDGCDLMFCTMCHVSFSWTTRKIHRSLNNHNPHYIEYVRNLNSGIIPRAIGDVPLACGGFPTWRELDIFEGKNIKKDDRVKFVIPFTRLMLHIQDIEVVKYRTQTDHTTVLERNQNLRVLYLLDEITEDEWKRRLQIRERQFNKNKAFFELYEMLVVIASELLNKLIINQNKSDVLGEIEALQEYYNNSVMSINKRFDMKIKQGKLFNDKWSIPDFMYERY